MSTAHLPTILLSLGLILLPGAFWLEKNETSLWQSRLLWPSLTTQPHLHTPFYTEGTYLPAIISENRTLTPPDNPVILTAPTTIAPGVTLALEPGVHLYALEHAALHVAGTLALSGTAQNPIRLTSNESYPANRSWSGLTVTSSGHLTGQYIDINYAYPAITCLKESQAELSHISINHTNTGLFTSSPTCRLTTSRIQSHHTGIISTILNPALTTTVIQAPRQLITPQP